MGRFDRAEVNEAQLLETDAGPDPFALFSRWFEAATAARVALPEAMTLATATSDGRPSARQVLLKEFGDDGFVFFTNYESRKARELEENPRAALTFHWPDFQRQVRIEGTVERTSEEDSAAYFRTRPRETQISAWASPQSREIGSRTAIEDLAARGADEFGEGEIPLPPFWGGYRVMPERIEFWQGREGRLHDRLVYERSDAASGEWTRRRLAP